jgi:hypothetical protein
MSRTQASKEAEEDEKVRNIGLAVSIDISRARREYTSKVSKKYEYVGNRNLVVSV